MRKGGDNMGKEVISHGGKKETYEEFIDKFKPKKKMTPDECYTLPEIYEAVKDWAIGKFNIPESAEIIRPFYPGGNYMAEEYPEGCVVIDNPPFSILKQICDYYNKNGVHYVLFCPALTSIKSYTKGVCYIKEPITYENGAKVPTAFTHNFYNALETAPELHEKIREINSAIKANLPKYTYPPEVVTANVLRNIAGGAYITG